MVPKLWKFHLVAPVLLGLSGAELTVSAKTPAVIDGVRTNVSDTFRYSGGVLQNGVPWISWETMTISESELQDALAEGEALAVAAASEWVSDLSMLEKIAIELQELYENLSSPDPKTKKLAILRSIALVNAFSLLLGTYLKTAWNAVRGKKATHWLFFAFMLSNIVNLMGAVVSESFVVGGGYAVASLCSVLTWGAMVYRAHIDKLRTIEQENIVDGLKGRIGEQEARIYELLETVASQAKIIADHIADPDTVRQSERRIAQMATDGISPMFSREIAALREEFLDHQVSGGLGESMDEQMGAIRDIQDRLSILEEGIWLVTSMDVSEGFASIAAQIRVLSESIRHESWAITDPDTQKTYMIPLSLIQQHASLSVYDIDGKPVYFTDGLLQTLGYTKADIDAHYAKHGEIVSLMYPEEHEQEHVRAFLTELGKSGKGYKATFYPTAKDGRKLAIEFSTEPIFGMDGQIIGTVRFARDVTGEHIAKQMLNVDMLTGEANRHGFEKRFLDAVVQKEAWKHDGPERRATLEQEFPKNIVMAFGDVDSFKAVNDTYGHGNADVILKEIAKDLRKTLRETDTVARLGGDEFAVICEGATINAIAPKLHTVLQEFSRTVFHIRDGVLVDRFVCASQEEAKKIAQQSNASELAEGEVYAGGVSLSVGLTEQRLDAPIADAKETTRFRSRCEQRAEKYAAHFLKHLDKILPGREGKNGVAYPRFDEEWHPVSVTILYRSAPGEEPEKIVIEGEDIERALKIIEEEGAKGRLAKILSIPLGEGTMQLSFSDSGELIGATICYPDGREMIISDSDILRRAFVLPSDPEWAWGNE